MKYIKLDEVEFRTFIARIDKFWRVEPGSDMYNGLLLYIQNQLIEYKKELNTDEFSSEKFKQLTINYD